jgi:hypothetical protein
MIMGSQNYFPSVTPHLPKLSEELINGLSCHIQTQDGFAGPDMEAKGEYI